MESIPYAKLPRLTEYVDPHKFDKEIYFKKMMHEARAYGASDIHIVAGYPSLMKVYGDLVALSYRTLDSTEVKNIVRWSCGRDTASTDIVSGVAVDSRFELFDESLRDHKGEKVRYGYRVNAAPIEKEGGTSGGVVLRAIPGDPPLCSDIGLPQHIVDMATPERGVVYISGSTGSGKSTTFAAIIRYILENETPIRGHIITLEEPIEFLYDKLVSKHSLITQSQIPNHFKTFADAIRAAMRRDPELIVIGEIRDKDSIEAAVKFAQTGHTVFTTIHASNVSEIMRSLLARGDAVVYDVINTAHLLMSQRLVKTRDGKRTVAREYLLLNKKMKVHLSGLRDMGNISNEVADLVDSYGHSFKKDAARLYDEGLITKEVKLDLEKTYE